MVHRYFATALGALILFILVMSRRRQSLEAALPVKHPMFLTGMVILQGAFGAWTVTLKLWPQVVTAHLLGGFATLALIWLLVQRTSGQIWSASQVQIQRLSAVKVPALITLVLVVLQVALGGWTTSNYAALACPDLPTCHGVLWPKADFAQGFNIFQQVGPNYLGGLLDNHARTAIHLSHRIGAVVVLFASLYLMIALWRTNFKPAQRFSGIILGAVALQFILGLSNVYWVLPLPIAVAHNAFGAVLLLVVVTANYRLRTVVEQGVR